MYTRWCWGWNFVICLWIIVANYRICQGISFRRNCFNHFFFFDTPHSTEWTLWLSFLLVNISEVFVVINFLFFNFIIKISQFYRIWILSIFKLIRLIALNLIQLSLLRQIGLSLSLSTQEPARQRAPPLLHFSQIENIHQILGQTVNMVIVYTCINHVISSVFTFKSWFLEFSLNEFFGFIDDVARFFTVWNAIFGNIT